MKQKNHLLWSTPLVSLLLTVILINYNLSPDIAIVAATTLLCAAWWIFEVIPIPVTALLPLALFTLTGVLTPQEVAHAYGHPLILLLLGGFILSQAMAHSGTHRRIALFMVKLGGNHSPRRLVIGFMAASALLSMWISNTATTLMLLPVAMAALEKSSDHLKQSLLLGVAYSASVGGLGTPIGSPPNALFVSNYEQLTGNDIGFLSWMMWALPVTLLFLPIMMAWITRNIDSTETIAVPNPEAWSVKQKRVLMVFAITALLWMTRSEPFGGWQALTGLTTANDASVALLMCVLMFIIPDGEDGRLLNWESANDIPWGVLLLFAGGICIAKAFSASGFSQLIGQQLAALNQLPLLLIIATIALSVTFLTEVTSNTATTALLLPILGATALSSGIDPALLMLPAALSASCAFMLPVATAPNAIVYGSNAVPIKAMVSYGLVLNLIGSVLITLICFIALT